MQSKELTEDLSEQSPQKAHVLVFASGKAGVGKSSIVANVASAMVQKGVKVCVVDAGLGDANVSNFLDMESNLTLEQVVEGVLTIEEATHRNSTGVDVVCGASKVAARGDLGIVQSQRLLEALAHLEANYDYLLIDTEAGNADSVLQFIESAPFAFLVITADSDSLSDGFSLLRLLSSRSYAGRLRVVVNRAVDYPSATETFRRFAMAAEKHLGIKVEYGGFVVEDEHVEKSVILQMAVVVVSMNAPASRCLHTLADNILKHIGGERHQGFVDRWKSLLVKTQKSRKPKAAKATVAEVVEIRDVAIPPQPAEVSNDFDSASSGQDSFQDLLQQVHQQCADRQVLSQLIGHLVQGFVTDYGELPQLWSDVAQPPRSAGVDAQVAGLLTQAQGDQQWLSELINELRRHYRHLYRSDVFDASQELLASIQSHDFAEERFEHLMNALRDGFSAHFNKPYRGQSELVLESTAEQLAEMANDEKSLQHEVGRLLQTVEQLAARRELLLSAISSARDGNLAIKSLSAGNR